jgi:hypothetical protein
VKIKAIRRGSEMEVYVNGELMAEKKDAVVESTSLS